MIIAALMENVTPQAIHAADEGRAHMTDAEAGRTRDFLGYGRQPPDPRWPNGAHVAVNFVINYEEGGEYSVPDGDKSG
jgi:hypothetical protein